MQNTMCSMQNVLYVYNDRAYIYIYIYIGTLGSLGSEVLHNAVVIHNAGVVVHNP